MAFDFKKEYKAFYLPPREPGILTVPPMRYIAVRGQGDPNAEDGEYQRAIGILYGVAYTLRMSAKGGRRMEGFWWQEGVTGVDYAHKENFCWISVIRLPDFVTKDDFDWAVREAERKKKADFSRAEYLTVDEGLCVQCMHVGPYDAEPETVARMHEAMERQGYRLDISESRLHHEIYLTDARKTAPEKLKTVIRHPIRKA